MCPLTGEMVSKYLPFACAVFSGDCADVRVNGKVDDISGTKLLKDLKKKSKNVFKQCPEFVHPIYPGICSSLY